VFTSRRRNFWERWTTRLAVMAVSCGLLAGIVYANFTAVPGYAPWQDKASTMLRQIGPTMVGPGQRYVQPDIRDFFYFTTLGGSSASPN
jgi:hypothetical protein